MLAVLSDENLLTHVLQSVSGERRKLEKRIAETIAKETAGFMDAKAATWTQRKVLELALEDLYPDRILLLMQAKPVSCFWRRVCRQALTDMEWHEADMECTLRNMMNCNNMTWRLPQRCTLHPRLNPFNISSSGFFDRASGKHDDLDPGNPRNSVLGTLCDLPPTPTSHSHLPLPPPTPTSHSHSQLPLPTPTPDSVLDNEEYHPDFADVAVDLTA